MELHDFGGSQEENCTNLASGVENSLFVEYNIEEYRSYAHARDFIQRQKGIPEGG